MTKDREERKKERKEKKEKKEKKERKEKKRREAEELAVKEKKISKKHKSKSKETEKPEKSKKKSKKYEVEEEKSPEKSKESKKRHKRLDESEEPQTRIVDSKPVTVPIITTNYESDRDFEFDKEDIKHLLESYSKEDLINLIYKTAEKGSKLISAVFESADRDSSQRNIFVRGLGWDTTHENLKAAFEVYGEIEECSVVMDKDTGRAKGFGFVLFKTRKGSREALRNPEKRMFNRTVSCDIAKPFNSGKPREPVESVKIDLTHTANQSETALPGLDLAHGHVKGLDKGHQLQQQNMPMYAGQNLPMYGHSQPPGFNPMYGAMMGNQGAMMGNQIVAGLPNYRMFGSGMMNQGPMVPPNPMGMAGQYVGDVNFNGASAGFDGERAWYLR